MWTGTTNQCNKQVYPLLSLFLTPLRVRGLAHCSTSYWSFFPSHLQLPNYLAYSAGRFKEMQNKNRGGFMPPIDLLWYIEKYLVDCGNVDAVVVVDETPALTRKMATSDGGTKVTYLAVSAIKQKVPSSAVGCALQHAVIMRYMLEDAHAGAWCQNEKRR